VDSGESTSIRLNYSTNNLGYMLTMGDVRLLRGHFVRLGATTTHSDCVSSIQVIQLA